MTLSSAAQRKIRVMPIEPEQILLYLSCLEPVEMKAEEFAANTTEQPRLVKEVLSEQRKAIT